MRKHEVAIEVLRHAAAGRAVEMRVLDEMAEKAGAEEARRWILEKVRHAEEIADLERSITVLEGMR